MNKHLIVIGMTLMLLILLIPTITAGYICDFCGGDGIIIIGEKTATCPICHGDGCVSGSEISPANKWKDDGSCGGSSSSSSSSSDGGDCCGSSAVIILICCSVFIVYYGKKRDMKR